MINQSIRSSIYNMPNSLAVNSADSISDSMSDSFPSDFLLKDLLVDPTDQNILTVNRLFADFPSIFKEFLISESKNKTSSSLMTTYLEALECSFKRLCYDAHEHELSRFDFLDELDSRIGAKIRADFNLTQRQDF